MGAIPGGYSGWWGNLGNLKQRGIISYQLSQNEHRAMAGVLKKGPLNMLRRIGNQIPYVGPGILMLYLTYTWGNARHHYLESKAGQAELGIEAH
ncbi:UcrQ family protein [Ramicandelaber brevisporus]|nr:UcrQ family protein [Ramicandelaber brevisporus]